MPDLYKASLDGYDLYIETIEDTFESAIARHDIPFKDGSVLENLGQKARSIKIRCYFWDDDSEHNTYAYHVGFINHLALVYEGEAALSELYHPMYGSIHGYIETVTVRHDDRQMTAEIDITFVEQRRGVIADVEYALLDPAANVDGGVDEEFLTAQDEQQAELADDLFNEGVDVEQTFDPEQSLFEQISGVSSDVRDLVKEVDGYITEFEATVTEVMQPVNSLVARARHQLSQMVT